MTASLCSLLPRLIHVWDPPPLFTASEERSVTLVEEEKGEKKKGGKI